MKSSKNIALEIPGVGRVLFKRSRRARHVNIRIKPFVGVVVAVPLGMDISEAMEIVHNHEIWINRHLQKVRESERRALIYDGSREIKTRFHKLDVRAAAVNSIHINVSDGFMRVRYPRRLSLRNVRVQSAIKRALILAYREEARIYLPQRLKLLARQHGFSYNRVAIKNHRSRWGSCSTRNNINLSLHLMRLPDALIDYVLLHELVHTRVKNHGQKFWELLEKIYTGAKAVDKNLRKVEKNLIPLLN